MIVDANLYWVPEALFTDEALRNQFLAPISDESSVSGYYGYLQTNANGQQEFAFEKPRGCQNLNYIQGEYRTEGQLRDMDAAGVDKVLKEDKERLFKWLEEKKLLNEVEAYG